MTATIAPSRRLLVVAPFAPRAGGRHGGARVIGQLVRGLAERHEVAVLHLADAAEPPPEPELVERCSVFEAVPRAETRPTIGERARSKLALVRGTPTWVGELATPAFARRLRELAAEWGPDVVQLEFPVMGQYLDALDGCDAPRVLVEHDAGLRDLRPRSGVPGRAFGRLDERAWRRFEPAVMRRVDAVVAVTERDRAALEALGTGTRVVEIRFGVPIPDAALSPVGEPPPSVVFVGGFRHGANVDAALWLGRELFPPVSAAVPEARLTIVGGAPPPDVRALAGPAVDVTGGVPDVTPYLDRAAVVAAPIRAGGGMRVKVLEALAAGKAVVASPVAVSGIDVEPSVHLEVAPDGAAFTATVASLLRDESRRRSLGEAARRWATEHLGWERPIAAYEALYDELLAR